MNNTGLSSPEDAGIKEITPNSEFEYDNLDTDHLLLHQYTVTLTQSQYFGMI